MTPTDAPLAHAPASLQKDPLAHYARNVNSQTGEDGIIGEMLARISTVRALDGWCVEFGAWDGIYLSNTYHLINEKGYKAVLIEGDPAKHQVLCKNIPREDVHKICRFVTFEGESTLDKILGSTPIPANFDFLSIDIDGCDYYILESLTQYRPKVICIEYNSSIPNEVEFVQAKTFGVKQGTSPRSLLQLANQKGYSLAAVTHSNLLLVADDLKEAVLGTASPTLDDLRDDREMKTFLFSGFDGSVLSNRDTFELHWHRVKLDLARNQVLPRPLRAFPRDYNMFQNVLFLLWLAVNRPSDFKFRVSSRLRRALKR
ncbi:FkbM family methyltransferase [Dongia sedimenti]|uniref:Methyltransferase FkbM domain-containing protein n=1 Tax=Dongia sedimenti TaxID=3064282 RepID=A0ABU0YU96_9PROT|nr:hypothetical protein [Rhodospirillaceae bacterium R-7]